MAQMVETVSVFAADRRLKKPLTIPRPGDDGTSREVPTVEAEYRAATHGGLLTAAMMGGKVVVSAGVTPP